ncbi:hypothetical protein K435DRAFT_846992 [Dendrothele bispora CBS 962.96]|uniref:Uncharacterized protein n=1 Tax=Dendrothele bispora (strain CBS 962.96) TaxID=1314807 RepID=A0A4S8KIC4_DENBC|nr:hypothetical protein K435DRAFT_846992 [Dendrothele bispora CBS 962.96]
MLFRIPENKASRRRTLANLFHACMANMVAPLKKAGVEGIVMQSGDGVKRRCHPILAAYVGDYPEQVLVTCVYSGHCASCGMGNFAGTPRGPAGTFLEFAGTP